MVVKRPKLSLAEQFYLPAIVDGLAITFKHLRKLVSGKTKATMQYPEERWDSQLPHGIAVLRHWLRMNTARNVV